MATIPITVYIHPHKLCYQLWSSKLSQTSIIPLKLNTFHFILSNKSSQPSNYWHPQLITQN